MRILSWNINGIRTLPAYHPWNTLKTGEAILDELKADIICFQEMKSSRQTLERHFAVPESYHSFFSFPTGKGKTGYSGVAVYTNKTPLKAEEGLTGIIQPKPPLELEERISNSYPQAYKLSEVLMLDEASDTSSDLAPLDNEGRSLVIDFGMFVLINVYCPNQTSDERLPFKMNFHHMLHERVRTLVEDEHREVIVIGDMNICAAPIDHCDGHLPSNALNFYEHHARAWFQTWLGPEGPLSDVVRTFWPDRKGMFTCWNQKISARDSNYGTRIDYILVTKGLIPWVKHGDIQPSLRGSDHCPIYIDLHDEITLEDGTIRSLSQQMGLDTEERPAPRLAAKYWDEYSGKQTMLSSFFNKGTQRPTPSQSPAAQPPPTPTPPDTTPTPTPVPPPAPPSSSLKRKESTTSTSSSSSKPAKKKKVQAGQSKLSSFFGSQPTASTSNSTVSTSKTPSSPTAPPPSSDFDADIEEILPTQTTPDQVESDYQLACKLSEDTTPPRPRPLKPHKQKSVGPAATATSWSALLAPPVAPKCTVHDEPAKQLTVNKPGPNKGKKFYVCSRPVGPGYDKGRSERLREEVNPEYKCDFFKWASDVKRDAVSSNSKEVVG